MNLEFTHKPNYFLYAQLFIRHTEDQLHKDKKASHLDISFEALKHLFQEDTAAVSTNLDSILHIASEYKVETLSGDQSLIQKYTIDVEDEKILLEISQEAAQALIDEQKTLIAPSSMDYN